MITCIYCKKEIVSGGKLWGCDGDFVCNDICEANMQREMDAVCTMSDSEFYTWMGVDEE